jgi:hypothetical protein
MLNLNRNLIGLASAIILIAGYDAYYLLRFPVAVGLDGYYYELQLMHLHSSGSLYYPTPTWLLFYILYAVDLTLNNSILTIKIVAIFLQVLLCVGLFLNIRLVTGRGSLGILSCILATVSGLHFFFLGEFLKNLLSLVFLIWAAYFIQRSSSANSRLYKLIPVFLLLLAFLSHKSSVAITLLLATLFVLLRLILSEKLSPKYSPYALLGLTLIWVTPLLIKAQSIVSLPASILEEVSGGRRWTFPPFAETMLLLVLTIMTLCLLALLRERLPYKKAMFVSLIAVWAAIISVNPLLSPLKDWDSTVGRLKALAYIQVALLVPCCVWLIGIARQKFAAYSVLALPIVLICIYHSPPSSMSDSFLLRRSNIVTNLPAVREHLCADPIVIATHGDQFVVSATLGVRSQKDWPRPNKYECTYWLLNMVPAEHLPINHFVLAEETGSDYAKEIQIPIKSRLYSVLISNDDLKSILDDLPPQERTLVIGLNPHLAHYLEATSSTVGARF